MPGAQVGKGITLPLLYSYSETDSVANVTLSSFGATIAAVEKQSVLHIVSVCL